MCVETLTLPVAVQLSHYCHGLLGFFVGRQLSRDVFEEYEGTELHQKFAEKQCGEAPGFRRTVLVGFAFEQRLSSGSIFVMVSRTP